MPDEPAPRLGWFAWWPLRKDLVSAIRWSPAPARTGCCESRPRRRFSGDLGDDVVLVELEEVVGGHDQAPF